MSCEDGYLIKTDGKKEPQNTGNIFHSKYRQVGTNYLTSVNNIIDINIKNFIEYRASVIFFIDIAIAGAVYNYLLTCVGTDNSSGGIFSNITKLSDSGFNNFTIQNIKHSDYHYEIKVTVQNVIAGANYRVSVHTVSFVDYTLNITNS